MDYTATNDVIIMNYFIRMYMEFCPFFKWLYQHLEEKPRKTINDMIAGLHALIQIGGLPNMKQES
jgi:hypothetical protein